MKVNKIVNLSMIIPLGFVSVVLVLYLLTDLIDYYEALFYTIFLYSFGVIFAILFRFLATQYYLGIQNNSFTKISDMDFQELEKQYKEIKERKKDA